MDAETIIVASVSGAAFLLLAVAVLVISCKLSTLKKRVDDLANAGRLRVQKVTLESDKNHAFHNPAISPDEELARRGFSMYAGEDAESGRGAERQTGGQFVEELSRELDNRQRRHSQLQEEMSQQQPPPPPPPHQNHQPSFLMQTIEDNKLKARQLANGSGGRHSETNPNFIY